MDQINLFGYKRNQRRARLRGPANRQAGSDGIRHLKFSLIAYIKRAVCNTAHLLSPGVGWIELRLWSRQVLRTPTLTGFTNGSGLALGAVWLSWNSEFGASIILPLSIVVRCARQLP